MLSLSEIHELAAIAGSHEPDDAVLDVELARVADAWLASERDGLITEGDRHRQMINSPMGACLDASTRDGLKASYRQAHARAGYIDTLLRRARNYRSAPGNSAPDSPACKLIAEAAGAAAGGLSDAEH